MKKWRYNASNPAAGHSRLRRLFRVLPALSDRADKVRSPIYQKMNDKQKHLRKRKTGSSVKK
jgi:hypothetical protein